MALPVPNFHKTRKCSPAPCADLLYQTGQ